MLELTVALQVLGIVVLLLLIGVLTYLLIMFSKINKKLDSILEMVTYYERARDTIIAFAEGPGKTYIDIAKTVYNFISPWLTKPSEDK